jgi:VCBS repeat-containing protein
VALREYTQNTDAPEIVTLRAEPGEKWVVSDSATLFQGTYSRSGPDLYISHPGADTVRIPDYFLSPEPADIYNPDGAMMRGDLVERLAGPLAPGQYAQTGVSTGPGPIGQVETVEGDTRVERSDGSVQPLEVGMKIFQNDIIETDANGAVSVTFVDGTIFTLAASSRMVIDELIYDPDSSDNSGTFSLIQGSFVFIAGQVAKTGGMDVNTPASTMGIRGTTVVVELGAVNGSVTSEITLAPDPDGSRGRVEVFDLEGNLIATITDVDTKLLVSSLGSVTRELVRTPLDDIEDSVLISAAFTAFRLANLRVDSGDTFVSLSAPLNRSNVQDGASEAPQNGLDVDSVDEPDSIDAPTKIEKKPGESGGTIDEGRIQPIETAPVVVVQGFEDATQANAIQGALAAVAGGPNANAVTYALVQSPGNGVVQINSQGQFSFVPNPNFNGQDRFTYTATGPTGQITQGTVVVEVLPVNDPPAVGNGAVAGLEDGTLTGSVAAVDVDGDTLSYSLGTLPANGTVVLAANGSYAYIPNPNYAGTDSFSIFVTDPGGAQAESIISVAVQPVNDPPQITSTPANAAGALQAGTGAAVATGTLSATDPDGVANLTWSGAATGLYGSFSVAANGVWTYALNAVGVQALQRGQSAQEVFTATVDDGSGGLTTLPVTVTVTGENDAPVVTTTVGQDRGSVLEGDEIPRDTGQLSVTDPDIGDTITWSGVSAATIGTFALDQTGVWTYDLNNSAADYLNPGDTKIETFTVTATDALGASVSQVVEVTVIGTNDAPIVKSNTVFSVETGTVLSDFVTAFDLDGTGALSFALGSVLPTNGGVVMNASGGFDYTPNAGYLGVDTFEYTVTDSFGDVSTATATIEVENSTGTAGGQKISLGLNPTATAQTAAGAVNIGIQSVAATTVNVGILLDSSGSIGAANWQTLLNQLDTAITALRGQYSGSGVQVDVQIIGYATNAFAYGPFDLFDASLPAQIQALPYLGGRTAWDKALDLAVDYFLTNPDPTDANFMLFLTDGRPSNGAWANPLAVLQNPNDNIDINIQAFGFGNNVDLQVLDTFEAANYPPGQTPAAGPDKAELLTSPNQLAQALLATPVFNPTLLSLKVELSVDGGAFVAIADETSSALFAETTGFEMPMAAIPNIETLLGDSNRFNVTVSFDLDGNLNTAEVNLFSTDAVGKAATAQTISGLAGHDLLFGSDLADSISGGAGNDVILGYDGADVIDGGDGADVILAGDGDDLLQVNVAHATGIEKLDGGAGRDTVALNAQGNINQLLATLDFTDVEAIDMTNGQVDNLQLTLADVIDLSSTADTALEALLNAALPESATIYGETGDTLDVSYDQSGSARLVPGGPVNDGQGNSLNVYEFLDGGGNILATLGVDNDIVVTTVPV